MIEYVEQLVEEKQYEKAIQYAEQLLLMGNFTPEDLLRINVALMQSRFHLGQFQGALVSGQMVLRLSSDLAEWDQYGKTCIFVSVYYERVGQVNLSISAALEYLSHTHKYSSALEWKPWAYYNLGIFYLAVDNLEDGIRALKSALECAESRRDLYARNVASHALAKAYMKLGDFKSVTPLLSSALAYLRKSGHVDQLSGSYLWHLVLRADFACQTGRYQRAVRIASRGLRLTTDPEMTCQFHLLLAKVTSLMGIMGEALGHCLAARVDAMRNRRYDLESLAAEQMYAIAANQDVYRGSSIGTAIVAEYDFTHIGGITHG